MTTFAENFTFMKKSLFLSALCALVLCSCSKSNDEENGSSFSKAEIHFDLAGQDYQGLPSENIFEYFSFNVIGTDFNGGKVSQELDMSSPGAVITCTQAPTEDKSLYATLGLEVNPRKQIPEGVYSISYSLHVHYIIYDRDGKEIDKGFISRNTFNGASTPSDVFENEMLGNSFMGDFELCYSKMLFSDEWNYSIAYSRKFDN